jgi:hypothetical protein
MVGRKDRTPVWQLHLVLKAERGSAGHRAFRRWTGENVVDPTKSATLAGDGAFRGDAPMNSYFVLVRTSQ